MITIVVIAVIALVGTLFAAMAIAPVLIEVTAPKPQSRAHLVLLDAPTRAIGDVERPTAA